MSREALEHFLCFKYGTRDHNSTVRIINTFLSENPVLQSSHPQLLYYILLLPSPSVPTFTPSLSFLLLSLWIPAFLHHSSLIVRKRQLDLLKKNPISEPPSGSVCHPSSWEMSKMEARAGFISTPAAFPVDEQWWRKCFQAFGTWPPAAGDDSDLWAVGRRRAEVTGGPPLLLTSAAHMEDIPEMKRQGLIRRAEVWHASVVIKQRSAEKEKQINSRSMCLHKHINVSWLVHVIELFFFACLVKLVLHSAHIFKTMQNCTFSFSTMEILTIVRVNNLDKINTKKTGPCAS